MHEKFAERLADITAQADPEESSSIAEVVTMAGKTLLNDSEEAKLYTDGLADYCRGARDTLAAQYYIAWAKTH
jgi:hypothetical protein